MFITKVLLVFISLVIIVHGQAQVQGIAIKEDSAAHQSGPSEYVHNSNSLYRRMTPEQRQHRHERAERRRARIKNAFKKIGTVMKGMIGL
jgi:ABC-type Na+ transport system ATPase subunit NatA